jgi:alpha-galactosidase
VRRDTKGVAEDEWGVGETHVWSGHLANGDEIVILLNAGGEDMEMSVSLAEIFIPYGPGGSAPHVKFDWAVHDLWANRMSEVTAKALLAAKTEVERTVVLNEANWYNATQIPYAQGLANDDARLFGESIGIVKAGGVLKAEVKSHAARVLRLRRVKKEGESFRGKSIARDEL